jgi:hypothetical protein
MVLITIWGYGHFGKSAEDGRLTLNFFIHLI